MTSGSTSPERSISNAWAPSVASVIWAGLALDSSFLMILRMTSWSSMIITCIPGEPICMDKAAPSLNFSTCLDTSLGSGTLWARQ